MILMLAVGIATGCVYGLVAVGYSLIYRTTGTFNLRIGGMIGAPDGDVRATISGGSVAESQQTNTGAAFPKPSGQTLVKVTGSDSIAALTARIRGISAVLRAST